MEEVSNMQNTRKLRLLDANILYSIAGILFFTIGAYFQKLNFNLGLITTQYFLILLPPIIYLIVRKIDLKKTLRLNKISIKHSILIVFITLLMYPIAISANTLLMLLMSLIGNLNIPQLPTATNTNEYMILIFIISISAGICEEVFFRGFILPGYENLGKKKAIIFSSILFGIFHFNLYNLLGPIVLGLVFSYLVILTDSIFAGIIGHITNNGFAVTLGFIINKMSVPISESQEVLETVEMSTTMALFINLIFFIIVSIITMSIASRLIKIIKKDMDNKNNMVDLNLSQNILSYRNLDENVNFADFIPLIVVLLLFLWTSITQIKEIIYLG